MTTLDFTKYFQNLRRLSFSDSLITKEKQTYKSCIEKLEKVKYSDYVKLKDLSDFEVLDDDFSNYYRWTGGQEMYDSYIVRKFQYENQKAVVIGDLSNISSDYKGEISMTFKKRRNKWLIYNVK